MKNKFLLEMRERGYINQCTGIDNLEKICNGGSITAYIGFDCTAESLHVGSLLQIMILKLMQKHLIVQKTYTRDYLQDFDIIYQYEIKLLILYIEFGYRPTNTSETING